MSRPSQDSPHSSVLPNLNINNEYSLHSIRKETKPNSRRSVRRKCLFSIHSFYTYLMIIVIGLSFRGDNISVLGAKLSSNLRQEFANEPSPQTAVIGSTAVLPCRVINMVGELQWTRDDFGLGNERELRPFKRYTMIGSHEEGKVVHG